MGGQLHWLMVGISLGLSAAIVVLALRDRQLPAGPRRLLLLVVTAGGAHSLLTAGLGDGWPGPVQLGLRLLSVLGIVGLWHMVRLLFDDRRGWLGFWAWGGAMAAAVLAGAWRGAAGNGAIALMATALSAHVLWLLLAGREADLDLERRLMRLWWAAAGAVYVLVVMGLHLVGGAKAAPLAHGLGLVAAQAGLKLCWLLLATGNPSPLVRLGRGTAAVPVQPASPAAGDGADALAAAAVTPAPAGPTPSATDPVALALRKRQAEQILQAVVGGGLYRQPRLTVQELADQVRLPEHRLRLVINEHLGFRNFNAFLNHHRLREAAARLRSAEDAHLPVLSIALTVGFGSIGPFNRAFRDAFGVTPTEFRRGAPANPPANLAENAQPLADS